MANKVLEMIAKLAEKAAISAEGTISWFSIYQPVEPESVRKAAEERRQAKLAKKMAKKK